MFITVIIHNKHKGWPMVNAGDQISLYQLLMLTNHNSTPTPTPTPTQVGLLNGSCSISIITVVHSIGVVK